MDEWQSINKILSESPNKILIEFNSDENNIIDSLNINEFSILGNVIKHISIININFYLRLLGGNNNKSNILSFNEEIQSIYPGNKLVIANDIWGGLFAISNGDFVGEFRNIWYFAPDELQWINLNINYSQFISWICSDKINVFYKSFMWNNMNSVIENIDENQAVLIYPFLWSKECKIENADKSIINLIELIKLNAKYQEKFFGNIYNQ